MRRVASNCPCNSITAMGLKLLSIIITTITIIIDIVQHGSTATWSATHQLPDVCVSVRFGADQSVCMFF